MSRRYEETRVPVPFLLSLATSASIVPHDKALISSTAYIITRFLRCKSVLGYFLKYLWNHIRLSLYCQVEGYAADQDKICVKSPVGLLIVTYLRRSKHQVVYVAVGCHLGLRAYEYSKEGPQPAG